jgi:hypothetical protein
MIQTDIDIGTKVRHDVKGTGVLIFNRCRQGNQVVVCEWDSEHNPISLININDLEIKHGSEEWIKVSELGKKKS